jgi:hypothetical protein
MVREDHWDWLQQDHGVDKTIWMLETDDRVPNSSRFPMDEIEMSMPAAEYQMFTSTVTDSLALALYLGYEHIEVYGADLSSNTEYSYQQPGWIYWVGVGKAMLGKDLVLHSGLQHFTNRKYGYEGEAQIPRDYFAKRAEIYAPQKHAFELKLMKLRDRISEALLAGRADRFPDLHLEAQNTALLLGEMAGRLQEASMYSDRDDPISRQQFERRGAQAQKDGDELRTSLDKQSGMTEYVYNAWKATGHAEAVKQLRLFYAQQYQYGLNVGGNMGVMRENMEYMNEYDAVVTAAGGERTRIALGVETNGSNL